VKLPNDKLDVYFATLEGEELAEALWDRVSAFYNLLPKTRTYARWLAAYQTFYGLPHLDDPWDMTVLGVDGTEGELSTLRVNHVGNVGAHLVTMTTQSRPQWQVVTTNSDFKSIAQTTFVSGLLDYFMVHRRIEENLFRACKTAVICGIGYQSVEWDPRLGEIYAVEQAQDPQTGEVSQIPQYEGDLLIYNLMPWDVVKDLSRRDADDTWLITRRLVSKWDLAARYPNNAEDILGAHDESRNWLSETREAFTAEDRDADSGDLIPIWTFFHKRTDACPNGRWASFLNGKLLLGSGALPYDQVPVLRITAGETLNTGYGDSPLHACLSLQDMLNRLVSSVATNNIAFGTQIVVGPDDADFSRSELGEGLSYLAVKPGPDGHLPKPEAINLVRSSPETYQLIELTGKAIETLSGVNSVVRGDPSSGIKSGAYAALIQAQALQFTSDLQASYTRLIEGTGNLIVQHLKRFAKSKRTAILAGKTRAWMQREFDQDDLQDIDRVMVQSANPITKSPAFKLQMAETMLQNQIVKTPEEYISVVETGSLQPLTEAKALSLLQIRQENEMIGEGQTPSAFILDNHPEHIKEHMGAIASPKARNDPRVLQAALAHIQQHIEQYKAAPPDLLLVLGIPVLPDSTAVAAAQQGGAPGGPPPPGGPPGPDGPPPEKTGPGGAPPGGPVNQHGPQMPLPPPQTPNNGPLPRQPSMPINPSSGQPWNPITGGK
jgi:hypothetical protein